MATESGSLNLQCLGSGEVRRRIADGLDVILIPVGSCERHGNPYTPLGIDSLVSLALVERAARKADVLHTPLLPFGYTPHHIGRVGEGWGTITLRPETFRRVLEDVGRSLVYQGFNKLIFVAFHSFNVSCGEEVLLSLRDRTGAFAAFYGGRESEKARELLGSPPERLASDVEAALALALVEERFDAAAYLAHGYRVHAPDWLGPGFSKRAGTGMAVSFQGSENIVLGMDDFEFVTPVAHADAPRSRATAEKGHQLLECLADDLAQFVQSVREVGIQARVRDFPDRVR
jgi:creatinine amidohydrolase